MKVNHGGNIYKFAKEKGISPSDIIDFSANINPFGTSPKGVVDLEEELKNIIHYPDPRATELVDKAAKVYGVENNQILVGNGASEILSAICRFPNFTGVLVPGPGFSEYEACAKAAGLEVAPIYSRIHEDEEYFEVPYLALMAFAAKLKGQDGRVIAFLGNPNNPDGSLLDPEKIKILADMYQEIDSLLVIDESFIDFTDGTHSVRPLINECKNIIILHSLTKFFAVPGLRVGLAFSNPDLINKLKAFIPTWSVNNLVQAYATSALNDKEYITKTRAFIGEECLRVHQLYRELPHLVAFKPSVNFMLIKWNIDSPKVTDLQAYLEEKNILIRSCYNYYGLGPNYFRIAIKTKTLNDLLYSYIKEFFYEHNLFG